MIEKIIGALYRAEHGKMNIPLELKRWDGAGNGNGHIDPEDGQIIFEKVIDDVSSIAQTASDVVSTIADGLSDAISGIRDVAGDVLGGLIDFIL